MGEIFGKNCATCRRAANRLDDDNGKCRSCCDDSKAGDGFPGYQPKQV